MNIIIRDAKISDSHTLVRLADQLGYKVKVEDVTKRLINLHSKQDERVIVAEDTNAAVIGWTTFRITEHIHNDPYVEISSFVVDQEFRRKGIGKTMMKEVEHWTKGKGLLTIRLSANVTRIDAHKFYETIGFKRIKQQFAFRKDLSI
ncbi:MAG: GNAT family N-acetyltransferase [Spirochaetia bacterium]